MQLIPFKLNVVHLRNRMKRFFASVTLGLLNLDGMIWRLGFNAVKMDTKSINGFKTVRSFNVFCISMILCMARNLS